MKSANLKLAEHLAITNGDQNPSLTSGRCAHMKQLITIWLLDAQLLDFAEWRTALSRIY